MMPENCPTSARNTVRYESERCPTQIGTLSDRNWNHCPTAPGIRTVGPGGRPPTTFTHQLPNKGTYFPNTSMRAGFLLCQTGRMTKSLLNRIRRCSPAPAPALPGIDRQAPGLAPGTGHMNYDVTSLSPLRGFGVLAIVVSQPINRWAISFRPWRDLSNANSFVQMALGSPPELAFPLFRCKCCDVGVVSCQASQQSASLRNQGYGQGSPRPAILFLYD